MPYKFNQAYRRSHKDKIIQKKRDWSGYNKKMKMRGDIMIWLSPDVIKNWVLNDRHYDGNGAPRLLGLLTQAAYLVTFEGLNCSLFDRYSLGRYVLC